MKTFIGLGLVAATVLFAFITAGNFSAEATRQENQIKATYANNEQILGTYTTKISEMAQIPDMAKEDLKEVMKASFEGRYGPDGSQATMQWIREAYPGAIDPVLYRNLQTEIASGRNDFMANQTILIDQKRIYQTNLDYMYKGFVLKFLGFPKINLDDYKAVTSTAAKKSFETGVDNGLTLK